MSRTVPEEWKKCQRAILDGVTILPKPGVPGTIIAFGDNAIPVLTGDDPYELIMTSSRCKNGTIIVFSHNGFICTFIDTDERFTRFNDNVKRWASNGAYNGNDDMVLFITEQTTMAELEDEKYRLFIWGCQELDDTLISTMINSVKEKGVGLIMGHCPWGWQQLNDYKPFDEAKFYPVLVEAGVCFTSFYTESGDDGGFKVENNKANCAHVGQILTTMTKDPKNVSKEEMKLLQLTVPALPDKIWRELSPRLTKILSSQHHKGKFPTPQQPINEELDKLLLNIQFKELTLSASEGVCAPGCKDFPGNYSEFNNLVGGQACLRISARFENERHSTGFYLPAGWKLMVTVQKGDTTNWSVRIGAHSDELHSNDQWNRWPVVCITKRLEQASTELVSPFGGLVYLENHSVDTLEVKLENVLETPYYDLTDKDLCSTWNKRRHAPGLWAELAGEHIIFTLPSSSVRELKDPASALRLWDKVLYAHNHLKGVDPLSKKRERVVCDVQPSAGYMHSGYPIVTHLDLAEVHSKEFVMNADYLRKEGSWGLYHEIGHNMQDGTWTFEGTGEVTCNIFTLHAMQTVSNKNPWIHSWLQNQVSPSQDYLKNGANFQEWKEHPGVALFFYAQLVNTFGWTCFKAVFRRYKFESPEPESEQDKIDLWFSMFSECVGYNIVPMALFWGIPLSENVSSLLETSALLPFLPNDEITCCKEAKERVRLVEQTFSDLVRVVDKIDYCNEKFEFRETDPVNRARQLNVLSWDPL